VPPKLAHYYKIFIEFPRISVAFFVIIFSANISTYLFMPWHPISTSILVTLQAVLGCILYVYALKIIILEIWRVRAANRWYDGKSTAGHETIKFTQAPYTEVPFAMSLGVFILSMIIAMFLLTHA
jgi:hypothetical protein